MSLIHCIGDSHTGIFVKYSAGKQYANAGSKGSPELDVDGFSPIMKPFQVHLIGPRIAFNIHKRKSTIDAILNRFWKNDDYVLFSCGELDCRKQILKHAKNQNISPEDLAILVANKYMKFIIENYKKYNLIGYFAVPTTENGVSWDIPKAFNTELAYVANEHNIPFVSLQEEMTDGNHWYFDGTHLKAEKALPLIIKQFKEFKLPNIDFTEFE